MIIKWLIIIVGIWIGGYYGLGLKILRKVGDYFKILELGREYYRFMYIFYIWSIVIYKYIYLSF